MLYFPYPSADPPDLAIEQINLPCQACSPVFWVWVARPFEGPDDLPHHGFPPGLQGLKLICHRSSKHWNPGTL